MRHRLLAVVLPVCGLVAALGAQSDPIGVIPNIAIANLELRLVTETRAADMLQKVRTHIAAQGFHIVDDDPDDATRARHRDIVKLVSTRTAATEAYRVSVTTPHAKTVIDALTTAR